MAKLQRWGAQLKCSFCGKGADRVAKMVAGSGVCICNECVDLCRDIIATDNNPHAPEDAAATPAMAETMGAPAPGESCAGHRRPSIPPIGARLRFGLTTPRAP